MDDTAPKDQVDAARAYEALFVPALFEQWAPRVAEAARVRPGQRVLDVACGTGVLARAVLARTGPAGYVAGLDRSTGMLAVARELQPAVDWRAGEAGSLPFPDGGFDAVVSQFGLMFFPDRLQALREMLRVLAGGGRLCVAVWDSLASMPAYAAEVALLERLGGTRAADALRAPFVLGEPEDLCAEFRRAGAASVAVATERGQARFPSVRTMVEADLRGWLPLMGAALEEERIARILRAAEDELRGYVGPGGRVAFEIRAHIVTAAKAQPGRSAE